MSHSVINQPFRSSLEIESAFAKIGQIDASCQWAIGGGSQLPGQGLPARDVAVVAVHELPPKPGLSKPEGQARLLHDLASIEMQAMELGLRTLMEFQNAPKDFRQQLAEITIEEGKHLEMSLKALDSLGFPFGTWPVHLGLWNCVSSENSLTERILIVHRYLEGSGLDAGETIRQRLKGVKASITNEVAERIFKDEIKHVQFGSDWFRFLCRSQQLDPEDEFARILTSQAQILPRRLEPIRRDIRREAGFTDNEIDILAKMQSSQKMSH